MSGSGTPDTRQRSFRLVCPEHDAPLVEALLAAQGFGFEPEPFHPLTRRCTAQPLALGASLAAFFGYIYIQDRSSMLPPLALNPPRGARVLDLCASPGSKTGFLAQLVGPHGFVLGNEPSRDRHATLRQNLAHCNMVNTATCSYPGQRLPMDDGSWEYIQLDPPCSGWGTTDKNPNIMALWRDDKVVPLITLQRELLTEAARLLAPGGRVLYSTCTTNVRENEEQVRFAVETLGLVLEPLTPFPGFVFDAPLLPCAADTLRVNGDRSEAQGFYLALLRKSGNAPAVMPGPDDQGLAAKGQALDRSMLCADSAACDRLPDGDLRRFGDTAFFLHRQALDALPHTLAWQGFPLGRMGKAGFRRNARLRVLLPDHAPGLGLNLQNAAPLAALLTGQSLTPDTPLPKEAGLYFQGLPLGWLRVKGNRVLWAER